MKRAVPVEKEETTETAEGQKPQRRGMEAAAGVTLHHQKSPTRFFAFTCDNLLAWQQKQQLRRSSVTRPGLSSRKNPATSAGIGSCPTLFGHTEKSFLLDAQRATFSAILASNTLRGHDG